MNKQKFLELVGAAEKATGEDIKALEKLVQQYPFFQNGHAVLAKASRAKKLPSAPKNLNTAAVYATNRNVFKDYISSTAIAPAQPVPSKPAAGKAAAPAKATSPGTPPTPKGDLDKFIEEVYANLENWKSSRDQYLKYDEKHPEDIVILPIEKEEPVSTPDFSELKQQIADEVSLEEAASQKPEEIVEETKAELTEVPESKIEEVKAPEPEPVVDEAPQEKEVSAFDMVLDSIEAQIDSKVEENRKKREEAEKKPAEEKDEQAPETTEAPVENIEQAEEPALEKQAEIEASIPEPKVEIPEEDEEDSEPELAPKTAAKKGTDGPEIEDLDDQMAELEAEIMNTTPGVIPEPVAEPEETTGEPEAKTEASKEAEIVSQEDIDPDIPFIDESVEEITPDTVYNFSSPPPAPMEAPADLSKKKPVEKKEEPIEEEASKEEDMISSEELSDIVDKVSEKVEADTTPGDPDKLSDETSEQIEEELQSIALPKKEVKTEKGNLEELSEEEIAESESIEYQIESSGDEDLDQFNEERKNLKLVPGASKGDKKFRLAILKRPHNFTKPKKEEEDKPKAKGSSEKAEAQATTPKAETSEEPKETAKAKKSTAKSTVEKKSPTKKKASSKKATSKKEDDSEEAENEKTPPKKKASSSKKLTAKKATTKKKDASDDEDIKKKTAELKRKKPDKDLQNSIIDSFISADPSIEVNKGKKSLPDNTEDLSERSTAFPLEVVTENLATILMEQGKIERAIEIYEKLILKNPQKKTYFASQIEKLNKL